MAYRCRYQARNKRQKTHANNRVERDRINRGESPDVVDAVVKVRLVNCVNSKSGNQANDDAEDDCK